MNRMPEAIRKLVPLLGSDKDGEVLNAVRMIEKILKKDRLDWHDLTAALFAVPYPPPPTASPRQTSNPYKPTQASVQRYPWNDYADEIIYGGYVLREQEVNFVGSMTMQKYKPTTKQFNWLQKLYRRAVDPYDTTQLEDW